MKPLIIHSEARAELEDAVAFYEQQRAGLGLELLSEVERAVGEIQQSPQRWPSYKATTFRRYVVRRFPYSIFFVELEEATWVVAVAHARRRPDYWRRRRLRWWAPLPVRAGVRSRRSHSAT